MTGLSVKHFQRLSFCMLLTLSTSFCFSDQQKTLRMALDETCPFTCMGSIYKGLFPDIVEAILKPHGYTIEYVSRSWLLSLEELSTGQIDLLAAVDPLSFPKFLYPEREYFKEKACFYGRNDLDWRYQGVDSLLGLIVGLIDYEVLNEKDGVYYDLISNADKLEIHYLQPSVDDVVKKALLKVISEKIDVVPLNLSVMQFSYSLNSQRYLNSKVANYGCLPKVMALKLAVSPQTSNAEAVIALLNQGFMELEKNNQYRVILERYNLD